MMKVLP